MASIVGPDGTRRRALMMMVGGPQGRWVPRRDGDPVRVLTCTCGSFRGPLVPSSKGTPVTSASWTFSGCPQVPTSGVGSATASRCGSTEIEGLNERCWPRRPRRSCYETPGCGPTPRWCPATCRTPPTPGCWPRRSVGSRRRRAPPGSRWSDADQGAGPLPCCRQAGARYRVQAALTQRGRSRRGSGSGAAHNRWARRPRRDRRHGGRAATDQRQAGAAPGPGQGDAAEGPRSALRARGVSARPARPVNDLSELLDATRQIAAQTRRRLGGQTPDGSKRRVSLHDPDARPIAKGRLGKPVEFGHKGNSPRATTA